MSRISIPFQLAKKLVRFCVSVGIHPGPNQKEADMLLRDLVTYTSAMEEPTHPAQKNPYFQYMVCSEHGEDLFKFSTQIELDAFLVGLRHAMHLHGGNLIQDDSTTEGEDYRKKMH